MTGAGRVGATGPRDGGGGRSGVGTVDPEAGGWWCTGREAPATRAWGALQARAAGRRCPGVMCRVGACSGSAQLPRLHTWASLQSQIGVDPRAGGVVVVAGKFRRHCRTSGGLWSLHFLSRSFRMVRMSGVIRSGARPPILSAARRNAVARDRPPARRCR